MSVDTLFWDVDTQVDFMDPDGNLPVPGATDIEDNLEKLTQHARTHGIPILSTQDTHVVDDPEFEQFPPHCVGGTPGHEKIPATLLEEAVLVDEDSVATQAQALADGDIPQLILQTGQLDAFEEPAAEDLLRVLEPATVVVYGVTTEFCVRLAVLGLLQRGYGVRLVMDAIKAIDEDDGREAVEEMRNKGAETVTTDRVLSM